MKNQTQIITIQKIWRGCNTRKNLMKIKDSMNITNLKRCIDIYINTINIETIINQDLNKKKIRYSNFPSHISENIVKFAIAKKYKIMPNWDTHKGDLVLNNLRIEVKGSINLYNGPPTFGPTEYWDRIYFVDGIDFKLNKYDIYEIKLSSSSEKWKNLKVNKTETFFDQCLQKRRPRLTFYEIKKQLNDDCKLFFSGHISELY